MSSKPFHFRYRESHTQDKNLKITIKIDVRYNLRYQNDILGSQNTQIKHFFKILLSTNSMVLINDYADTLLEDLSRFLEENEYSSVNLPDYTKTFQVAFFSGVINLQNGKLNNLNTIVRLNDSTVTYAPPYLRLYVPMKSTALNMNYTYTAQVMGMKPTGTVHGNITNCEMVIDVGISLANLRATLFELRVKKVTGLSLAFQGSGFFNSIVNGIKNMLIPTIEEFLPQKFEEFLLDLVHDKFSYYNSTICETLDDC
ncbi:hypothetical protein RI129_005543 [Pyrocoelia pectoralis]|uniref:Uncharacterized protein n=1 Tax=Pyrocoelia pectoralis TaxID=417401 RepID=A0AAN7VIB7_9COLE